MTLPGTQDETPRPVPRYGEYATPEQLAEWRSADGAATPALPMESPAAPPTGGAALQAGAVASTVGAAPRAGLLRRIDRPLTIALLLLGVINAVQYGTVLLDFEKFLEVATEGTVFESIDFGEPARVGGILLFAIVVALVVAAGILAFAALRRSRIAFWIPLVAAALTGVAWFVLLVVIMLQTPGALPTGS